VGTCARIRLIKHQLKEQLCTGKTTQVREKNKKCYRCFFLYGTVQPIVDVKIIEKPPISENNTLS
jgi:hypothetical protein